MIGSVIAEATRGANRGPFILGKYREALAHPTRWHSGLRSEEALGEPDG